MKQIRYTSSVGMWLLIASIVVFSCQRDNPANEKGESSGTFPLSQARHFFEANAPDLQLAKLLYQIPETKQANTFVPDNIIPQWNRGIFYQDNRSVLYEIPLKQSQEMEAGLFRNQAGRRIPVPGVEIAHHLVIQRFHSTGFVRFFIATVIGKTGKKYDNTNSPYLYSGDRRGFEGYMILSDVLGEKLDAWYYRNNVRWKPHLGVPIAGQDTVRVLRGIQIRIKNPLTKAGGDEYPAGEGDYETCPYCGRSLERGYCPKCGYSLDDVTIIDSPSYCDKCGMLKGNCSCGFVCPDCGQEPCQCQKENVCSKCGSPYCNGECTDIGDGKGESGGGGEPDDPITQPADSSFAVSIAVDGGGTVSGDGTYEKGKAAILNAIPVSGYVFGGWSGDYTGRTNPATLTVDKSYSITAHFYSQTSDCGKLAKSISNYAQLQTYRGKIKDDRIEHGYIKSSTEIKEGTGGVGKIALPYLQNTIEMVHTHELEIHLSQGDLTSIYRRFMKGDITDYQNFTYTVVSPDYFVVLQIADESKMKALINDSIIVRKRGTTGYELSEEYKGKYDSFIVNQSGKTIEDYFGDFVGFMNDIHSGFSISLHKTIHSEGEVVSKFITDIESIQKMLRNEGVCKK